ncbi:glycosyltransferase [Alicyclobacillus herbarius]|uniref:glycosyltransferase n=1 Tax=Alicyclobacillus herbarius TaxID=122960 RepID=UPI0003FF01AA|nr:glycosyltransferase [Alicyclobacillus herbarius]
MNEANIYRVFMLMHGIRVETGGMTRVMLNRSKMLSERGHQVALITLDEADYIGIGRQLRKLGRLGENVGILNIYDDLRAQMSVQYPTFTRWRYRRAARLEERGFRVLREETRGAVTARYYHRGRLVKTKQWDKKQRLQAIEYYDEADRPVVRLLYNRQGFVHIRQHLDPNSGAVKKAEYCTADGYVFLRRWYTENGQLAGITLYDRHAGEERLFRDEFSFHVDWLNQLCRRQPQRPFIICDGIGSAPKVLATAKDVCYRIFPTHSTHLNAPYTLGSPVKKSYQPILQHLDDIDALVVPTTSQFQDVCTQFGPRKNVFVIPHSVTKMADVSVRRNPQKVVMVTRLNPEKAIEEAILAFHQAMQGRPDAVLEIYGEGPCRAELEQLVAELGCGENVRLMRYLTQVETAFRGASMMIMTSKFEGFPMVILESMWNETPVISYDINYGPRDVIRDGETGYLIPPGNRQQLADRIRELLDHPERAREMGRRARRDIESRYSERVIGPMWEQLFSALAGRDSQSVRLATQPEPSSVQTPSTQG